MGTQQVSFGEGGGRGRAEASHEGYLLRRGGTLLHSWTRLWAAIEGSTLRFYDERDGAAKRDVSLDKASILYGAVSASPRTPTGSPSSTGSRLSRFSAAFGGSSSSVMRLARRSVADAVDRVVASDDDSAAELYRFSVKTPRGEEMLATASEPERLAWVEALKDASSSGLFGGGRAAFGRQSFRANMMTANLLNVGSCFPPGHSLRQRIHIVNLAVHPSQLANAARRLSRVLRAAVGKPLATPDASRPPDQPDQFSFAALLQGAASGKGDPRQVTIILRYRSPRIMDAFKDSVAGAELAQCARDLRQPTSAPPIIGAGTAATGVFAVSATELFTEIALPEQMATPSHAVLFRVTAADGCVAAVADRLSKHATRVRRVLDFNVFIVAQGNSVPPASAGGAGGEQHRGDSAVDSPEFFVFAQATSLSCIKEYTSVGGFYQQLRDTLHGKVVDDLVSASSVPEREPTIDLPDLELSRDQGDADGGISSTVTPALAGLSLTSSLDSTTSTGSAPAANEVEEMLREHRKSLASARRSRRRSTLAAAAAFDDDDAMGTRALDAGVLRPAPRLVRAYYLCRREFRSLQGTVTKQARGRAANWKRRWFYLAGDLLRYYREPWIDQRGFFEVASSRIERVGPSDGESLGDHKSCFRIASGSDRMVVSADSDATRDVWIKTLRKAADVAVESVGSRLVIALGELFGVPEGVGPLQIAVSLASHTHTTEEAADVIVVDRRVHVVKRAIEHGRAMRAAAELAAADSWVVLDDEGDDDADFAEARRAVPTVGSDTVDNGGDMGLSRKTDGSPKAVDDIACCESEKLGEIMSTQASWNEEVTFEGVGVHGAALHFRVIEKPLTVAGMSIGQKPRVVAEGDVGLERLLRPPGQRRCVWLRRTTRDAVSSATVADDEDNGDRESEDGANRAVAAAPVGEASTTAAAVSAEARSRPRGARYDAAALAAAQRDSAHISGLGLPATHRERGESVAGPEPSRWDSDIAESAAEDGVTPHPDDGHVMLVFGSLLLRSMEHREALARIDVARPAAWLAAGLSPTAGDEEREWETGASGKIGDVDGAKRRSLRGRSARVSRLRDRASFGAADPSAAFAAAAVPVVTAPSRDSNVVATSVLAIPKGRTYDSFGIRVDQSLGAWMSQSCRDTELLVERESTWTKLVSRLAELAGHGVTSVAELLRTVGAKRRRLLPIAVRSALQRGLPGSIRGMMWSALLCGSCNPPASVEAVVGHDPTLALPEGADEIDIVFTGTMAEQAIPPDSPTSECDAHYRSMKATYASLLDEIVAEGGAAPVHDPMWAETLSHQIDVDLPRTFSGCRTALNREGGKDILRSILGAYSVRNPMLGYCQSMNYIASMAFVATRNEVSSFQLLARIVEDFVPGYHTQSMMGLRADSAVLQDVLTELTPAIMRRVTSMGVPMELVATEWLMCVLSTSYTSHCVARLWDVLFYEGPEFLIAAAAGQVLGQARMLASVPSLEGAMECLKLSAQFHDADDLIASAYEVLKAYPKAKIEERRREQWKTQVANHKAGQAGRRSRFSQLSYEAQERLYDLFMSATESCITLGPDDTPYCMVNGTLLCCGRRGMEVLDYRCVNSASDAQWVELVMAVREDCDSESVLRFGSALFDVAALRRRPAPVGVQDFIAAVGYLDFASCLDLRAVVTSTCLAWGATGVVGEEDDLELGEGGKDDHAAVTAATRDEATFRRALSSLEDVRVRMAAMIASFAPGAETLAWADAVQLLNWIAELLRFTWPPVEDDEGKAEDGDAHRTTLLSAPQLDVAVTLAFERSVDVERPKPKPKPVVPVISAAEPSSAENGTANDTEWPCNSCTFLNPPLAPVCGMCGRRRDGKEADGFDADGDGGAEPQRREGIEVADETSPHVAPQSSDGGAGASDGADAPSPADGAVEDAVAAEEEAGLLDDVGKLGVAAFGFVGDAVGMIGAAVTDNLQGTAVGDTVNHAVGRVSELADQVGFTAAYERIAGAAESDAQSTGASVGAHGGAGGSSDAVGDGDVETELVLTILSPSPRQQRAMRVVRALVASATGVPAHSSEHEGACDEDGAAGATEAAADAPLMERVGSVEMVVALGVLARAVRVACGAERPRL